MIGFPALMALIQTLLMIFVFPYDTPKMHKQRNEQIVLQKLMNKLYEAGEVQRRIDAIPVDG